MARTGLKTRIAAIVLLIVSPTTFAAHAKGPAEQRVDTKAYELLSKAATALGMVRGMQRTWRSINRIYFVAEGTRSTTNGPHAISRAFVEMSYTQHAVRSDVTYSDSTSEIHRSIGVARGYLKWQESEPGIFIPNTTITSSELPTSLYATPHGIVRAALEAETSNPGSISLATPTGERDHTLVFESPVGNIRLSVSESFLPNQVVITNGDGHGSTTALFNEYHDWELLDVLFPKHIRYLRDGAENLTYSVQEFRTNPYVVFPIPDSD